MRETLVFAKSRDDLWATIDRDTNYVDPDGVDSDGLVGPFLRHLAGAGWLSQSADVVDCLEYESQKRQNSAHRTFLDKRRNLHSVVKAEREYNVSQETQRRLRGAVFRGQRWIDDSISSDPSS